MTGTPTQPGGGVIVSSGMWKAIAAFEGAFLSRGKCVCTDQQDAMMDQNLQAVLGRSGTPVSPVAGLITGIITIFLIPIVVEFSPMIKEYVAKWWEKQQKKKEEQKAAKEQKEAEQHAGVHA
jgi:hypothetical protein